MSVVIVGGNERILARKSNTGLIVYNGVEYQGRHEPIISLETYQKAMLVMLDVMLRCAKEMAGRISCPPLCFQICFLMALMAFFSRRDT